MKFCLAVISVLLAVLGSTQSVRVRDECDHACNSCKGLSIFMESKTCPNCHCLSDLRKLVTDGSCKKHIDRSIYCPAGFEVDFKGCATGMCNQLDCDWSMLAKCERKCTKGYLVDTNGCPTCECQCESEGKTIEEFAEVCKRRCPNNDEIILEEDKTGCLTCICQTTGIQATSCKDKDLTLDCKNSCGKWPRRGGCSENRCDCRCPMRGLSCENVECPFGMKSKLVKDEFGCELTCDCVADDEKENKPLLKNGHPFDCPTVTCPVDCGPYELMRRRDENGCLTECRCKCMNPKCPLPCANGFKFDRFGCATCECRDKLEPGCLGRGCNSTCGPYEYRMPLTEMKMPTACRTDCECRCPSPACPKFCMDVEFRPDRYGCLECGCKNVKCTKKMECKDKCGPHGVVKRWDGCPSETCECRCPKLNCPPCATGLNEYMMDGYGCPTCQCKCPVDPPKDCPPCPNGYKVNEFGCQETCECRSGCPHRNCDLADCPTKLFAQDKNGCETCDCCPIDISKCENQCKIFRADERGCPTCQCAN